MKARFHGGPLDRITLEVSPGPLLQSVPVVTAAGHAEYRLCGVIEGVANYHLVVI